MYPMTCFSIYLCINEWQKMHGNAYRHLMRSAAYNLCLFPSSQRAKAWKNSIYQ